MQPLHQEPVMAAIETTRVAPFGAISVFRAVQLGERIIRAIRARLIAERTHSELVILSSSHRGDRDLRYCAPRRASAQSARRRA